MGFASIIQTIDNWLWGVPLIALLFGTHIFMTIRTGFVLVSCIIKHPSIDVSEDGSMLSSLAFATIPVVGTPILVIGLICFTFTTMLSCFFRV